MSQDEELHVNDLQDQLECANRNADEIRACLSSALSRSNDEAKLYRGLFWCLLTLATIAAIVRLIQP